MDALERIFGTVKPVIAMLHFPGLPGRPLHDAAAGPARFVDVLRRDLAVLQEAGFDGLLFCNEADYPYQIKVGPEIRAAMAAAIGTAALRAARSRSGSTSCGTRWPAWPSPGRPARAFIREVLTGVYESDLGMIEPQIGDIAGYRTMIGAGDVALFDNILPEFASAIGSRGVADRAKGAAFLGMDAILISGPAAGVPFAMSDLRTGQGRRPRTRRSSPTPASEPSGSTRSSWSPTGRSSGPASRSTGSPGTRSIATGRCASWTRRGPLAPARSAPEARWPERPRSTSRRTCTARASASGSSSTRARRTGSDVLVLGGDIAGKAIQTIVRGADGRYRCTFVGTTYDVEAGPDLDALEQLIADHGYYPYRAEPGELDARRADGSAGRIVRRADAGAARGAGWRSPTSGCARRGKRRLLHARQRRPGRARGRSSTRRRGAPTPRARWSCSTTTTR